MPVGERGRSSRMPLLAIVGVLAVALVVGLGLRLASGDSNSDEGLPAPEELPATTVAVVEADSGRVVTIDRREFDHALEQAAAAASVEPSPQPGDPKYAELKETALGELLDSVWIEAQAAQMGISVTKAEIDHERKALKDEAFDNEAQYREFLDESHFNAADVDRRVKAQLLSTRVQHRISSGKKASQSEQAKQKAFADFIKRFNSRWRSRTVCAPAFAIERCSNGETGKTS